MSGPCLPRHLASSIVPLSLMSPRYATRSPGCQRGSREAKRLFWLSTGSSSYMLHRLSPGRTFPSTSFQRTTTSGTGFMTPFTRCTTPDQWARVGSSRSCRFRRTSVPGANLASSSRLSFGIGEANSAFCLGTATKRWLGTHWVSPPSHLTPTMK